MPIGTPVWGATTADAVGASSTTVAYPAGVTAGDLLIIFHDISLGSTTNPELLSGWTGIVQEQSGGTGVSPTFRAQYKFAVGGESGSIPINNASGTPRSMTKMCRISGVDTSSPIIGAGTTSETNGGTKTVAGVESAVADALLMGACWLNTATATWTAPDSWTEDTSQNQSGTTWWIGHRQLSGTLGSSSVVFDHSATPRGGAAVWALRPAVAPSIIIPDVWNGSTEDAGVSMAWWDGSSEQAITDTAYWNGTSEVPLV